MKVYVVIHRGLEADVRVLGVFATLALAEAAIKARGQYETLPHPSRERWTALDWHDASIEEWGVEGT